MERGGFGYYDPLPIRLTIFMMSRCDGSRFSNIIISLSGSHGHFMVNGDDKGLNKVVWSIMTLIRSCWLSIL